MQDLRLHVNVDHVATLRQARHTKYPDPVFAAYLCESVGAAGITVHLREDRRHIQERDVYLLRESVQGILNLEMGASPELIHFACELRPDLVTLVPERREELTTEGGLDVVGLGESLQQAIQTLQNAGVPVSLFVAPDSAQVEASHRAGVRGIELHTGHYCEVTGAERQQELARLAAASKQAAALGLEVAAGHGLTCENVSPICHLPEVVELNIGHGIVSRAVFVGMERAVQEMLEVMRRERIHAQKR